MLAWLKENWVLLAFLGVVAGALLLLRSKPSNVSDLDELQKALTAGQPTVVTFYSNY
jgi:hypothetical protein